MEDYNLKRIQKIADKNLTYNKDINQHIESCKISIQIIKQKDEIIEIQRELLTRKNKQLVEIEEINLKIRKEEFIKLANKDLEIKDLREVIKEQYELIDNLMKRINKN